MNRTIRLNALFLLTESGGVRHTQEDIQNWILEREHMNGFILGNQPTDELERENTNLRRMLLEPSIADGIVEIMAERDRAWKQANLYRLQAFELKMAINKARMVLEKPGTDEDGDRWKADRLLSEAVGLTESLPPSLTEVLMKAQQFAANIMIANHTDPGEIIIHKIAARKVRNELHELRTGEKVGEDE